MTEIIAGRRRLGRGLEALLGPTREEAEREGSLVDLPVREIRPNPFQPRQDVDAASLEELKSSIQQAGLLQPVVVRTAASGGDELIARERALLALEDPRVATTLAREAVAQGLSVREVEDRVRGGRAPERRPRLKRGVGQVPEVRRIEEALRRRLGTDVRVTLRARGKGQIHVAFYSNEDLARLLEVFLGAPFDG